MIIVRKYNKDGSSSRNEFDSKLLAFLWLNDNLAESEWCWVMYQKEGENNNESVQFDW